MRVWHPLNRSTQILVIHMAPNVHQWYSLSHHFNYNIGSLKVSVIGIRFLVFFLMEFRKKVKRSHVHIIFLWLIIVLICQVNLKIIHDILKCNRLSLIFNIKFFLSWSYRILKISKTLTIYFLDIWCFNFDKIEYLNEK